MCPDKIYTREWLEIVREAHRRGLKTTSTVMFGHIEGSRSIARHLLRIRNLQKITGGITEFVPLPFVHEDSPIFLRGQSRRGPTMREALLVHATARLVLHPHIRNIQVEALSRWKRAFFESRVRGVKFKFWDTLFCLVYLLQIKKLIGF